MATEIERKFLVRSDAWRAVAAEREACGEGAALDALIRGGLKRLAAR